MKRLALFVSLLVASLLCQSQSQQIDSLKRKLENTSDKKKKGILAVDLADKLIRSNLFEALEFSDKALDIAQSLKNDSLLMAARLCQGKIYINLGNYPRSLQLFQQVIQWLEKFPNKKMEAVTNGSLGSVYYYQRDHKNALKYYLTALENSADIPKTEDKKILLLEANLANNVGIIYSEAKRYDSAIYYYDKGFNMGSQINEFEVMANLLNNYGTVYESQGNVDLAYNYYMKALRLREAHNIRLGLARSYHNIGQFYFKKKHKLDSSVYFLNKAISLGSEIGAWQTVGSACDYLYATYESMGDYKRAFETLKKSRAVNDSLFNEESTRKIAQLEMQFEFDKKQAQQEADQKQKEFYFWTGGTGLGSLLIIVTLLFFLQRSKTKRSELEQAHLHLEKINLKNDLAIKDKELATNIMYLLNKNELINHLSEKLLDIKSGASPETQTSIQKVIIDLQANSQPELWQEFEFRFQQVHEQFYKVLNERFPDLSPAERRLCAFLKLNMTTKEISAITHQNAKSIDVARTRLRKKLNLTGTDQNLVTFLSQLDEHEA